MQLFKDRTIRIFLSSTFRDFGEERDLLVRQVFPALRARLKDRFVELVDVDLRWGITVEQAERGEVLPICLAEIDRSRPYFIGLVGERYGWIPPADVYSLSLCERQPWLKEHLGGKSVTELEVLHGVLNNPRMADRALFYFRSRSYAVNKGGDYLPVSPNDSKRQRALKARILSSGLSVGHYRDPELFASRLENDLWKLLDKEFPPDKVPSAFERESRRHEAYAAPRRRLYLGQKYLRLLLAALNSQFPHPRILIEGESGGGKSALIANALYRLKEAHPQIVIHEHYVGASGDAADPLALVRRIVEAIAYTTGSREEVPSESQRLLDSLPAWLAHASAWARKKKTRWIIALDALNSLSDMKDLGWFPEFLPPRIHFVVSCLPGQTKVALESKGKWKRVIVSPLTRTERKQLLTTYLARYNKVMPASLSARISDHPLAKNPLFVRTLAEELRLFGVHEELAQRLTHYLRSQSIEELFTKVLERVENDCGKQSVRSAMEALWASRAGLTEGEILGIVDLVPATWAPIRNALDEALLQSNDRIIFAHEYIRAAVHKRYLSSKQRTRAVRRRLAKWFQGRPADERRAEEEPYQLKETGSWKNLERCLAGWDMFSAVTQYRSKEELLYYWLQMDPTGGEAMLASYEKVWRRWSAEMKGLDRIKASSNLMSFLQFAGHYGRFVEKLARYALYEGKKQLGKRHHDLVVGAQNLAQVLQSRHERKYLEEASSLMEELIGKLRKLGDKRLLADSLDLLGGVSNSLGLNEKAKREYLQALKLYRSLDGPNDPRTTARVLNNLGDCANMVGNHREAERWMRQCLAVRRSALPADHPLIGVTLDNLAGSLVGSGKKKEASRYYSQALEIRERSLGPHHPETNTSRVNWATLLLSLGKHDQAEQLYKKAVIADKIRFGLVHEYTVLDSLSVIACLRESAVKCTTLGKTSSAQHKRAEVALLGRELSFTLLLHRPQIAKDTLDQALKSLEKTVDFLRAHRGKKSAGQIEDGIRKLKAEK